MSSIDRGALNNGIASVGRERPESPIVEFPSYAVPVQEVAFELATRAVAAAAVLAVAALLLRKVVRSI